MTEPPNCHYHIRWSGNTPLDWERFATADEAEAWAAKIVRSGETYTVEKFGEDCIRCEELRKRKKQ